MKTKDKIIEILTVYFDGGLGRGSRPEVIKCSERIMDLFSHQKQEIVEEIEKVLPKEEEFEEDESKYPDARWQRENYGKKKYDQAIKQVKHNISTWITSK